VTEKKRKSKRPKSMHVTTEASKAKLPKPKRKRYRFVEVTCSNCKTVARVRGAIGRLNVHDCGCGHSDQFRPLSNAEIERAKELLTDTEMDEIHRAERETWAEGYAKWEAKAERAKRVQCPRCEKLVLGGPHDIHTCYDAKALRELPTSPIAGQPLDGIGTIPAPEAPALPYGEDVMSEWIGYGPGNPCPNVDCNVCYPPTIPPHFEREIAKRVAEALPPDTSAYPWGLKAARWLDGVPTRVRRWLAARLRWLAGKVMP